MPDAKESGDIDLNKLVKVSGPLVDIYRALIVQWRTPSPETGRAFPGDPTGGLFLAYDPKTNEEVEEAIPKHALRSEASFERWYLEQGADEDWRGWLIIETFAVAYE